MSIYDSLAVVGESDRAADDQGKHGESARSNFSQKAFAKDDEDDEPLGAKAIRVKKESAAPGVCVLSCCCKFLTASVSPSTAKTRAGYFVVFSLSIFFPSFVLSFISFIILPSFTALKLFHAHICGTNSSLRSLQQKRQHPKRREGLLATKQRWWLRTRTMRKRCSRVVVGVRVSMFLAVLSLCLLCCFLGFCLSTGP